MLIPIRCFTCGKSISDKWEPFIELTNDLKKNNYTILILTNLAFDTTVLTQKTNYLFKSHFDWLKKTIDFTDQVFINCGINSKKRPEELDFLDFINLSNFLSKYKKKL